jgi:uncharacterized protein YcbX
VLTSVGSVSEAWRYPIKSLGGVSAGLVDLDRRGVRADRGFAVYGDDRKIGSGKSTRRFRRMDGLLECRVRLGETGEVVIVMAGGEEHAVPSDAANKALSAHVGEPVRLAPETNIQHFDAAAIHLVTSAGLHWLARRLGDQAVDTSRFRPNLVVNVPGTEPHVEETWIGRRLRLGGAILKVTAATERCVMVGMAQPGVPSDERILRLIAQEHDACFGVYASVEVAGTIRVGDPVHLDG